MQNNVQQRNVARAPAIAVDLDSSLIRVDTLHEGVVQLLAKKPWLIFELVFRLIRGKSSFKKFVHWHAPVDVKTLPVRGELLEYLSVQKASGRQIGLFSAARQEIVDACNHRFNIFDVAVGTTDEKNLAGREKLASIRQHLGHDFVYAGDSAADLAIWRESKGAIYVGRSRLLRYRLGRVTSIEQDLGAPKVDLKTWAYALRIHQWSKNFLVFLPAVLSIPLLNDAVILDTLMAFAALCLLASATYILNDLVDLPADRRHTSKKTRPFASGAIPAGIGIFGMFVVASVAATLIYSLPLMCAALLAAYAAVSLTYSFYLKQIPILDVLCLAFLFTIRLAIGASLLENSTPYWLYAFSMFFFTSLAFVKRYTELAAAAKRGLVSLVGRSYRPEDLPLVLAAGLGAAVCSIVIFLIYLGDRHFDDQLFQNPAWLGLSVACLAYWLLRTWLLTLRGQMHDDPIVFALKDSTSYGLGFLVALSLFLAW